MSLKLTSESFIYGGPIPVDYTCDGEDMSPRLMWEGGPEGAASYALVMDDPDAPGGIFTHWIVYNIPPNSGMLEKFMPINKYLGNGSIQGKNDFGRIGYGGPCPPRGEEHRYYFRLYALDNKLENEHIDSRDKLLGAMEGHILEETDYMGRYGRRP